MPETIGFLLLSAAGVTEIAGFSITAGTAAIVGNVALATAAIGLSYALSPSGVQDKPQDGQLTVRQALPARRRNYGLVKISGPIMFSETLAGVRYQVLAINQGEIDSYVAHWLDDAEAVLSGGGVIGRFNLGAQIYVSINYLTGTDSDPALANLVASFPSIWTSAHQGKGIAKILMITGQPPSDKFTTVYPGGQPPIYRAIVQSSKAWDPRDPGQDRDDKSTWTYTTNSVLIALDFHRHADGMGMAVFDNVFFTDVAITEDWIPAADICDEVMLNKDLSSSPRYRCCGGYDLNQPPKDTLAAILATCDGQTFQRSDGAIGIRVGKTIVTPVSIEDEHILGYEGLRHGPPDSLVPVNKVTAKYTDINLDFQEIDADDWRDQDAIDASGREEARDISLLWVPAHPQARRLMKLAFYRFNPEWSGRIITDLDGLRAWGERYIHLVISELGIDGSFELTAPPEFMPGSMTVTLTVASLAQAAFDWNAATEEGTAPNTPDTSSSVDIIADPTGVNTSVAAHAITIAWDDPTRLDEVAQAQYSLHGTGNWFAAAVNGTNNGAVTPALAAGTYDIQVRFVVGSNVSNWVPDLSIVVT